MLCICRQGVDSFHLTFGIDQLCRGFIHRVGWHSNTLLRSRRYLNYVLLVEKRLLARFYTSLHDERAGRETRSARAAQFVL